MNSKLNELGKEGEKIASLFLKNHGYQILHENYRYKYYEVDLIAKENNTIVFIEVKRRNSKKFGYPEQFVDATKKKNLRECANHFMSQIPDLTPLRFDIISIFWPKDADVSNADIVHFKDAFY